MGQRRIGRIHETNLTLNSTFRRLIMQAYYAGSRNGESVGCANTARARLCRIGAVLRGENCDPP